MVCISSVQRKNHDANATDTKITANIEIFERLDESPIALQFQEIDKKLLTKLFIKNDAKFHKSCNNQFSDMKIERAEKRLQGKGDQITEDVFGIEQSCSSAIQGSSKRTSTRLRITNDSIAKCFFFDNSNGTLLKVLTFQLEKRVRKCANILGDNVLLGKLSSGDMIALDAMYHSTCFLNLYSECNQKETDVTYDDTDKQIHGQVLSEHAQYMEQVAKDDIKNNVFKLVDLARLYKERAIELGGHTSERVHTTKLKNRLLAHVENLREYKDKKLSYLTFDENVGTVLKSYYEKSFDNEAFLLSEAAKILRCDIFAKD